MARIVWADLGRWETMKSVWLVVITAGLIALGVSQWRQPLQPVPEPIPAPVLVPDAPIRLPVEVKAAAGDMIDLTAETKGKVVRWYAPDGVQLRQLSDRTATVVAKREGRYVILAWTCLEDGPTEAARCTLLVGLSPDPLPVPVPPQPVPQPPVPPIPVQGFRVLLVNEYGYGTKEQLAVLNSPKIQEYLTKKCVGGKDGWRRLDKDVDPKYFPDLWKSLWVAVKPKIATQPALVVVVDTEATVYPLPSTEEAALEILRKYGGS